MRTKPPKKAVANPKTVTARPLAASHPLRPCATVGRRRKPAASRTPPTPASHTNAPSRRSCHASSVHPSASSAPPRSQAAAITRPAPRSERRSATRPSTAMAPSTAAHGRSTNMSRSRKIEAAISATRIGEVLSRSYRRTLPRAARAGCKMQPMDFRRVDALPPYAFAEVERLKLELRRAGEDVIDLGFGNPDVPPHELAIEKLREAALLPRNHRYSSSRGLPRLREAVCALYRDRFGVELDPEREVTMS